MSVSSEKPMIAVVDDDRAVAKAVQRLLHASGLNAIAFTSGAAFLESLTSAAPDCVVLDLVMPEPDGLTVQARLKAAGVTAPVIFLSASQAPTTDAGLSPPAPLRSSKRRSRKTSF